MRTSGGTLRFSSLARALARIDKLRGSVNTVKTLMRIECCVQREFNISNVINDDLMSAALGARARTASSLRDGPAATARRRARDDIHI
jgi:hypothetical protein